MPYVKRLSRVRRARCGISPIDVVILTETARPYVSTRPTDSSEAVVVTSPLSRFAPPVTIYHLMISVERAVSRGRGSQANIRLLKAARALFLLKGLAAVTVDDICLAASASKGAFYHHFPNKRRLFLLVALEELERELQASAQGTPDAAAGRHGDALLLDLWAWAPRHPQARRRVRAVHRATLRELSKSNLTTYRGPHGIDREAQATLALVVSLGRLVQSEALPQLASGRARQARAAG